MPHHKSAEASHFSEGSVTSHSIYQLLALCARAECRAVHYRQMAEVAAELTEWKEVLVQAQAHRMSPLLYTHLKAAGVPLAPRVRRELRSRSMYHLVANQTRMRVLRDVLTTYAIAGIPALVLKGAAVANTVYADLSLRPMSDVDILVPEPEARRAQQLLAELGFDAPSPSGPISLHRHLAEATLQIEGVPVTVEIHHRLSSNYLDSAVAYVRSKMSKIPGTVKQDDDHFEQDQSQPAEGVGIALNGLTVAPYAFSLGELTAYTLGHEDMLGHLCQHLATHVNVWDFARLIWMADIVSLAERFASEIAWDLVRRRYPVVLNTLSVLHAITPLSDDLLGLAPIKVGRTPEGIGVEYQGWPHIQRKRWRKRGYQRVLRDTLYPSEWWLRLHYRLGSTGSLFWYRWVRYPLHILGHAARVLLERLGWPTSRELTGRRTQRTLPGHNLP